MSKFSELTDRELLERIYAAQLRTKMDVETIMHNVEQLRKKVDPDAFSPLTNPDFENDNPYGWRHIHEIHDDFDNAYDELKRQDRQGLIE